MVELLKKDIKPRDIMTFKAFENAMVLTMAMGGSTNAVLHFIAMARCVADVLYQCHSFSAGDPIGLGLRVANAGMRRALCWHHRPHCWLRRGAETAHRHGCASPLV